VTFAVTYQCNCRCKTCNIWQKRPREELSLAEIKTFIIRNNCFSFISLTGGEIFLRADIRDIFDFVLTNSRYLVVLQFPTNGLLTDEIKSVLRSISVSKRSLINATVGLDGPPELHDQIRGIPGTWERALETFKILKDLHIRAFLGMTISSHNQGMLLRTYRSVKNEVPWVKPEDFHINIAHISPHFYANEGMEMFDAEVVKKELAEYVELKSGAGNIASCVASLAEDKYAELGKEYVSRFHSPLPCKALNASCFIDPEGNVYPCTIFDQVVGNIRDAEYCLKPIWESPHCTELYKQIQQQKCPQCWTPCEAFQAMAGSLLDKRLWI